MVPGWTEARDGGEPYSPRPQGSFWARLRLIDFMMKRRDAMFDDLARERDLPNYIADMLIVTTLLMAVYGLLVGVNVGGRAAALMNPVKLPWLLILTLALCVPSLHIFSAYLGSKLTFAQNLALATTSVAIIAIVLTAFAPIVWFFMFASNHYEFGVFVNLLAFSIGGLLGVSYLFSAAQYLYTAYPRPHRFLSFLTMWIMLYGVVGAQMAYNLGPYFSQTDRFFNPRGDVRLRRGRRAACVAAAAVLLDK
jgi:hypothetical protein